MPQIRPGEDDVHRGLRGHVTCTSVMKHLRFAHYYEEKILFIAIQIIQCQLQLPL